MNNPIDDTLLYFRSEPDYHQFLWGVRHLVMTPALGFVWCAAAEKVLGDELTSAAYYIWPIAVNLAVALVLIGLGTWGLRTYCRYWSPSVPFATALRWTLTMAREDFFVPGASHHG